MNAPPRDPFWIYEWAWPLIGRGSIPATPALVLLQVAEYADGDGIAFPSTRTIAKLIGRSDRTVREAFETLGNLGLIDGTSTPRRATRWRLITDEIERVNLVNLRALSTQIQPGTRSPSARPLHADSPAERDVSARAFHADTSADRAPRSAHLRTNCDPVPPTELEVEINTPCSPLTVPRDVRGRQQANNDTAVTFDPTKLVKLRKVAS